jgi:hypothetical protein
MNALCWWLVNLVSRALTPDERDAVRGDLLESGESAGEALFQVLGLVVRRQATLWTRWRPWAALLFLAMPLGILFGLVTKVIAYHGAMYLWLYTNYWSWTIVENAAYRNDLIDFVASTLIDYGILAVLAWCCGRALGFLSRGGLLVNGALFSGLLFFGELLYTPGASPQLVAMLSDVLRLLNILSGGGPPGVPRFGLYALERSGSLSANAMVFEHTFYRYEFHHPQHQFRAGYPAYLHRIWCQGNPPAEEQTRDHGSDCGPLQCAARDGPPYRIQPERASRGGVLGATDDGRQRYRTFSRGRVVP